MSILNQCFCCNNDYIFSLVNVPVTTLALGSQPRQGGCKVAGQEGDPGITSHAPESAKSVRA
jgi:hypothetical protein